MRIVAIDGSPAATSLLRRFYADVYVVEFPDADERESLENMLAYIRQRETGGYGPNNYHILIALDGGDPVGCVIADYFARPNAGVIEFITVAPELRRAGFGRQLHDTIIAALEADARHALGRSLDYVFAEMNDPLATDPASDNMNPAQRATIWAGWGYRVIDFPYVQPALSAEQSAVRTLCLLAKAMPSVPSDVMSAQTAKALVRDYLVWAMRIGEPEADADYQAMAAALDSRETVGLIALATYLAKPMR